MRDYLSQERSGRGDSPGPLTYSERIARSWCEGEKQARQMRAKTEAFEREAMREAIRATSEMRREITPRVEQQERVEEVDSATKKAETILNKHRRMIRDIC